MLEHIDMDKIYYKIKLELEKRKSWFSVAYTYVAANFKAKSIFSTEKINSFMTSDLLLTRVILERKHTRKH